jgi:DNA-binding response OmpR family regulator
MTRTILVVDDETTLRETLVEALEIEGYRAIPAADGREALTRFRADHPDLVLLDLMLPELSGVEVCRILRAESAVPIIMLTAKDGEVDKIVRPQLQADDRSLTSGASRWTLPDTGSSATECRCP